MQKGVSFFLTILFILPLILYSTESIAQEIEERLIVIKGSDDWKNTKLRLYPADEVEIRANGEVCFNPSNCHSAIVNPDGWDVNTYKNLWHDYYECDDPIKTVNHAALIGNVGSDDFFIGKNANFTGKDGFLYLGINDCTLTGEYGNSGQFEVYIKVTHIK